MSLSVYTHVLICLYSCTYLSILVYLSVYTHALICLLFVGYFKSVEKFIIASDDQLEFETQDDLKETPLLVAVRAGMSNIETINIIIKLGGKAN